MAKADTLRKLKLYKKNPDLIKEVSNTELADLVVVVLSAVQAIDEAIKEGRLDGYTPQPDRDYLSITSAKKLLVDEVQKIFKKHNEVLSETATELDKRVNEAINRIRDGEDGIVTDEEIERAAVLAYGMLELPDFDSLVEEKITANPESVRNALELLEDGEKLSQEAVEGLVDTLKELREIRATVQQAGGVSRNTVLQLIAENASGVTDGDKGDITVSNSGATWTIDDDTIGLDELSATGTPSASTFLRGDNTWAVPAGSGDVSKVGTPVGNQIGVWTGDGTIEGDTALTFDTTTDTLSTVNIAVSGTVDGRDVATDGTKLDGIEANADVTDTANVTAAGALMDSEVTNLAAVKAFDPTDYAAASHTHTESDITDLKNYEIKAVANGSLTAVLDTYYVCVSNSTFTDPTPVEGEGFAVFVRNGTATVGGTGYSTAGTVIHRIYHSGAWANYVFLNSSQLASTYQPLDSDLTTIAAANNGSVLAATTASFTTADETKLDGIEALADVTDETNVVAALSGATLTGVTVTGTDKILIQDASDADNLKTVDPDDILALLNSASTSVQGIVELATTAEVDTGTDATRAITPDALNGSSPDFALIGYDAARGKVTAGGNLGATETINFNSETNYTGTLDSNITFTFANATSGDEVTLFLSYDGTAQRTITWPTVTWLDNSSGAAPTTPAASGNVLVVTVRYIGTTFYASATGNYTVYA